MIHTYIFVFALLSRKLKWTKACGGKSFYNILIEVLTPLILHVCLYSLPFQASFLAHWHISDQIIVPDAVARQVSVPTNAIYMFYTYSISIYMYFLSQKVSSALSHRPDLLFSYQRS